MAFNSTGKNLNCGFSFFSLNKLIENCVDVFALLAKIKLPTLADVNNWNFLHVFNLSFFKSRM